MERTVGIVVLALLAAVIAEKHEVFVPKEIYTHKSYCPGEKVEISCAIDGDPFKDYQLTSLTVRTVYTATNQASSCKTSDVSKLLMQSKGDLCTKNYVASKKSLKAFDRIDFSSECTSIGCSIDLPSIFGLKDQSGNCDSKDSLIFIDVSFECSGPGAVLAQPDNLVKAKKSIFKRQISDSFSEEQSSRSTFNYNSPGSFLPNSLNSQQQHSASAERNSYHNDHRGPNSRQNQNNYSNNDYSDQQHNEDRSYQNSNERYIDNEGSDTSRSSDRPLDGYINDVYGWFNSGSRNISNTATQNMIGGKMLLAVLLLVIAAIFPL